MHRSSSQHSLRNADNDEHSFSPSSKESRSQKKVSTPPEKAAKGSGTDSDAVAPPQESNTVVTDNDAVKPPQESNPKLIETKSEGGSSEEEPEMLQDPIHTHHTSSILDSLLFFAWRHHTS